MKEKIDLLISFGIPRTRIAKELGVSETAIRNCSIGKAKEMLLDDFITEIQNATLNALRNSFR